MRSLVFLALAAASLASLAQPITVDSSTSQYAGGFSGGTAGTFQADVSHSHVVSGADYSFNLRGDVTAQFLGTANFFSYQASAQFTLVTGAAPVRLSNIAVSYNAKEVPSGGSTATFTARQFYRGELYVPGFGQDFSYGSYLPDRTVQGVYIEDLRNTLANTYLAANTEYLLYMDVYPSVFVDAYPSSSSMLGYALEYGGTVAPVFDGLTVTFSAVAVPEPATGLLAAAGVLALGALRRRTPAGGAATAAARA